MLTDQNPALQPPPAAGVRSWPRRPAEAGEVPESNLAAEGPREAHLGVRGGGRSEEASPGGASQAEGEDRTEGEGPQTDLD